VDRTGGGGDAIEDRTFDEEVLAEALRH
jgi:hypothetical protein